MKKSLAAIAVLVFLGLLIWADRTGIIHRIFPAGSEAKIDRLLVLPPDQIQLSSPLWGYKNELQAEWRTTEIPEGLVEYRWEGYLDADSEIPGIEAFSGLEKVPFIPLESFPANCQSGFRYTIGKETFKATNLSLPPPHVPEPLSFDVSVGSASAWIVFQARNESSSVPHLEVSLGGVWKTSLEIAAPEWKTYCLALGGIQPGTLTLALDGTRSSVPAFFIRNLRVCDPARITVRLKASSPSPAIHYHPEDPVASLLSATAPKQPSDPVRSPWNIYDEDERWVRTAELNGTVRTCAFLPSPSEITFETEAPPGSALKFYPTIQNPLDPQRPGKATLKVHISSQQSFTPLDWEHTLTAGSPAANSFWEDGVTLPLPGNLHGPLSVTFSSETISPASPSQPLLVGEPGIIPAEKIGKPHPRSIVLICIDTLRADSVSCLGCPRKTTPWIDQFFGEGGVRFTNAQAPCTWTFPSHASLFLSQYVSRHGAGTDDVQIGSEVSMLAELFAERGYETSAFVDGGFMGASYGFSQGFGRYDQTGGHLASILPRCTDWLERRDRAIPLFLFLHTFDVHAPYNKAPESFREMFITPDMLIPPTDELKIPEATLLRSANEAAEKGKPLFDGRYAPYWRALYDGGVRYVDQQLEEWYEKVLTEELLADPLIILISDHGESFYEHGSWGHTWNVYEELARVPVLFHFPGQAHAGVIRSDRVSLVDLPPTLFEYLGWEAPESWQGESLLPLIQGTASRDNEHVYTELSRSPFIFSASYLRNRKLIETMKIPLERGEQLTSSHEVYDLESDPGEKTNLYHDSVHQASREFESVHKALAWMRSLRKGEGELKGVDLNAESVQELRGQGYLK